MDRTILYQNQVPYKAVVVPDGSPQTGLDCESYLIIPVILATFPK